MKIPKSEFNPVTADLIETIRLWRNSPRVRENMLDDTEIQPQQQKQWFESLPSNKDKQYRIFYQDSKPVGMLYFSGINKESCAWGCYIGEEAVWPGTGVLLSIAALDYAFNTLKVERLCAEVFESNTSPIRMHQTFGYTEKPDKLVTTKSGKEIKLKCFEYLRTDWKKNRKSVLTKLPKQIIQAADFIVFN
jgi:UDP-4-amino-4,6-dideoxy-N-acetyl-beta-L-altrosamine N-acetyltransferase